MRDVPIPAEKRFIAPDYTALGLKVFLLIPLCLHGPDRSRRHVNAGPISVGLAQQDRRRDSGLQPRPVRFMLVTTIPPLPPSMKVPIYNNMLL